MKRLLFCVLMVTSTSSFANLLDLKGYVIPAAISVSYYENLMPTIGDIPEDRRVFQVRAVVEFCRTVHPLEFEIHAQSLETGGYVLNLVTTQIVLDCFGPKKTQTLTYPLPMGVDRNGPFLSTQPIAIEDMGDVH